MAEKTEDALGGIAAPKAEEAKSAAKTYETPLKEAYEAGDLPAPESAVGGTGNGSGVRPADPNGPEERIARLRRQSAWLAAAFVFLFVFMMVVWMNDVSRRDLLDVGRRHGRHIHSFRSLVAGACA